MRENKLIRYTLYNLLIYIGINIGLVGFGWIIVDFGGNSQDLAIYTLICVVASILTSLFFGVMIDKHNNFKIIKAVIALQGLVLFVFMLGSIGTKSISLLFILGGINSVCLAIYNTASRGAINYVVSEKEALLKGNSMLEISIQGGAIFASLLTGVLYERLGATSIFVIMSFCFIVGALLIKVVPVSKASQTDSYIGQMRAGSKVLLQDKKILILGISMIVTVLSTLLSNTVLPLYVKHALHQGAVVFGITDMIFGVGAVAAGVLAAKLMAKNVGKTFYLLSFFTLVLLFVIQNTGLLFVLYLAFGFSNTLLKIELNTELMQEIKENQYAQTTMLLNIFQSIFQILLGFLVAGVMEQTSAKYGFAVMAMLLLSGFLIYRLNQKSEPLS